MDNNNYNPENNDLSNNSGGQNYNNSGYYNNGYNNGYNNNGYNNGYNNGFNNYNPMPEQGRGKSIGSMVCGILSIVFCSCYGIPGLILAIVALCLQKSYKTMNNGIPNGPAKAGLVCGIIGLIFSILFLILYCIVFFVAAANLSDNFEFYYTFF